MSNKAVSPITRRVNAQRRWYVFCLAVIGPFVKWIYRFRHDKCKIKSKTFLALANHTQNLDPALLVMGTRRHIRFVANATLTKGFAGIFLNGCFGIIPRQKGASGDAVISLIEQNLKEGVSVGMFPEGNRCWDGETEFISRRTASLAKNSGAALVTYKLTGGYMLRPRWADTRRKGGMYGTLVREYTPEELAQMSEDEVYQAICRDLHVDAFEEQAASGMLYPGKDLASGLEKAAYLCPCCNSLGSVGTKGDEVFCTACGMRATLNPAGRFESETLPFTTFLEWNRFQKKWMCDNAMMLRERVKVPIASETGLKVTLMKTGCVPEELSASGTFNVFGDRFEFEFPESETGKLVIPISETTGFGTFLTGHLYFNCGSGVRYQMVSQKRVALLKYYALWRVLSGRDYR